MTKTTADQKKKKNSSLSAHQETIHLEVYFHVQEIKMVWFH